MEFELKGEKGYWATPTELRNLRHLAQYAAAA